MPFDYDWFDVVMMSLVLFSLVFIFLVVKNR